MMGGRGYPGGVGRILIYIGGTPLQGETINKIGLHSRSCIAQPVLDPLWETLYREGNL